MNPQAPYGSMPGPTPNSSPSLPPPYQGPPLASMKPHRSPWGLIIALVVTVLLLLAALAFGYWAFGQYQDYKNNSDKKAAAASAVTKKQTEEAKDKEFAEEEKNPYKIYKGPAALGTLSITYPKTWSAFMDEGTASRAQLDGYMHPNYVPAKDSGTSFALRTEVVTTAYDQVLNQYDGNIKKGTVKVSPYSLPKVPSVLGARVDGEIANGMNGSMVVFPLRDKTIKISTQSQSFINDFNNIILPNLTFVP